MCDAAVGHPNLCDSFEDFGQLGMCSSCVFTGEKNPKVTLSSFILTAVIICGITVVLVIQRVSTWPKHLGQHWRIRCEHHAVTSTQAYLISSSVLRPAQTHTSILGICSSFSVTFSHLQHVSNKLYNNDSH